MRLTPFEVAQHSFANPVVKFRLLDLGSEANSRVGSAVCRTLDSIYSLN